LKVFKKKTDENVVEVFFPERQIKDIGYLELDIIDAMAMDGRLGFIDRDLRFVYGRELRLGASSGQNKRLSAYAATCLQDLASRRIIGVVM
jgi:hypothetical protein